MIPPFSTFGEDERPDNPLVQDMLSYMNDDSLYSIPWDFSTFPSQEFKNQLGSYLLEYAQGNMAWDDVVKQTTDCWASEKACLHNSRVYRLAFSERKMPHDTVNVADFAALECKAAVKSVAVCAMREKQQNL